MLEVKIGNYQVSLSWYYIFFAIPALLSISRVQDISLNLIVWITKNFATINIYAWDQISEIFGLYVFDYQIELSFFLFVIGAYAIRAKYILANDIRFDYKNPFVMLNFLAYFLLLPSNSNIQFSVLNFAYFSFFVAAYFLIKIIFLLKKNDELNPVLRIVIILPIIFLCASLSYLSNHKIEFEIFAYNFLASISFILANNYRFDGFYPFLYVAVFYYGVLSLDLISKYVDRLAIAG